MRFIEPYSPKWKSGFESIKQAIESGLGGLAHQIDIQHIGSTSVEGLVAKPILDIDIIIENKLLLPGITAGLERLGYTARGEQGIPGRFAFRQQSDKTPITGTNENRHPHHLYVCYADSPALKNHILFRDALRNDPDLLRSYADLKMSLAADLTIAREEYTIRKTGFIISVLARAGLNMQDLEEISDANAQK